MTRILSMLVAVVVGAGAAVAQQAIPGAYFIEQWDGDGDGRVTPEEARQKRADVFGMFDQNEDDLLQPAEWAMIADHLAAENAAQGQGLAKGMGQGPGTKVREAMQPPFNDLDGDGEVTSREFTEATDKLFSAIDRNGDGLLTVDDLGRG